MMQRLTAITHHRFSLFRFRSPLLTESLLYFLFLRVLRCFTSPRQPPHKLCIHLRVTPHNRCWVSPFGHPRINALLATPRGITQPHTSFIGSACQGIHHTPVTKHTDTQTIKANNTKTQKRKILASTIQFSHNTTPTQNQAATTAAKSTTRAQPRTHNNLCCPRHPTVHQCNQSSVTQQVRITHPTPHSKHPTNKQYAA